MEGVGIYPRLLRRVRAVLIDSMLVTFVIFSWWLCLPLLVAYSPVIKFAYPLLAWFILDPVLVWKVGGTPGHYYMGLRVQSAGDGSNIGLPRAIFRSIAKTLTGSWSFIFVMMTRRHQALHDVFANTTVVLREPELHTEPERVAERSQDLDNYRYPSALRRVIVIIIYIVLSVIVLSLITGLLISNTCLMGGSCSVFEIVFLFGFNIVWMFFVPVIMIVGWRSQLFGARRSGIENIKSNE